MFSRAEMDEDKLGLYGLLRAFLFRLDPEDAHKLTITLLKTGLGPRAHVDDDILHTNICGLDFSNPVGLAAGFDKQAEAPGAMLNLGFGFVELGSITPLPQPGNPRPRLFRVMEAEAVINRFGFNSDGMDVCLRRFAAWRAAHKRGIIGINVGKNKDSTDAAADYVAGVKAFAPHADYLTVNVSSPNTPNLRDLQGREQLAALLKAVMAVRNAAPRKPPLFVKVAPDLTGPQQEDIAEVVLASGVSGLIVGNTTITRPGEIPSDLAMEAGGLSGKPLMALSTQVLADFYKLTQGRIPLIGCGGISSGADAYAKIRAGASLVQLYTALVYKGPSIVPRIAHELVALLRRDGFKSVKDAVGKGNT
jgi:dihydroorotate dehydrogenase